MKEVTYYFSTGLLATLHRKKKAPWTTLPMQIRLYAIKNMKVVDIKGKAIKKFSFGTLDFNMYTIRSYGVQVQFIPWNALCPQIQSYKLSLGRTNQLRCELDKLIILSSTTTCIDFGG